MPKNLASQVWRQPTGKIRFASSHCNNWSSRARAAIMPENDASNVKNVVGQLTQQFQIPPYAQEMLYVVTSDGAAQARGKQGQFTLDVPPTDIVRITWGAADGPTLAFWDNAAEWLNLRWDGRVKVGGFVERLHAREVGGRELVIAEVVGRPFAADHLGLPSLDDMRNGVFARPAEIAPLDDDQI